MFILFDIGGTKIRISSSLDLKSFSEPKIFSNSGSFEESFSLMKKIILEISGGQKIEAVCGGVAGMLNKEKTGLLNSQNMPDWEGKLFGKDLSDFLNCPVYLENDADIIGLGEAVYGSGVDYSIVSYLTVSTGVGGARIVDGKIDRNSFGFEPGHHIIDKENNHDLEWFIGGASMEKRFGRPSKEIKDEQFWDDFAKTLAVGLRNISVFWSSEIIVLGGAISLTDLPLEKVKKYFEVQMKEVGYLQELKLASLGDVGGLYGAMAYLKDKR